MHPSRITSVSEHLVSAFARILARIFLWLFFVEQRLHFVVLVLVRRYTIFNVQVLLIQRAALKYIVQSKRQCMYNAMNRTDVDSDLIRRKHSGWFIVWGGCVGTNVIRSNDQVGTHEAFNKSAQCSAVPRSVTDIMRRNRDKLRSPLSVRKCQVTTRMGASKAALRPSGVMHPATTLDDEAFRMLRIASNIGSRNMSRGDLLENLHSSVEDSH